MNTQTAPTDVSPEDSHKSGKLLEILALVKVPLRKKAPNIALVVLDGTELSPASIWGEKSIKLISAIKEELKTKLEVIFDFNRVRILEFGSYVHLKL